MSDQPIAWGMPRPDGTIIDCITPEEHAREPGQYTVPLYAAPQPKAEPDDGGASADVNETNAILASHYLRRLAMDEAIAAGDGVLLNEQALLLRECRNALNDLLRDKPMLAGKNCGTTTLGNLRAMLYDYRPQGVFGVEK
jgi:hypothetical protein